MKLVDAINLIKKYGKCPKCGCDTVGGGTGTIDIGEGYFQRTCSCGWRIELHDNRITMKAIVAADGKDENELHVL